MNQESIQNSLSPTSPRNFSNTTIKGKTTDDFSSDISFLSEHNQDGEVNYDLSSVISFLSEHNQYFGNDILDHNNELDFSKMIATMQPMNSDYDFYESANDHQLADPDMDNLFASVANSMSIYSTLDYIDNAFSGPVTNSNGSIPVTALGKFKGISGAATLPIFGTITSRFGFRPKYNRMHKGVDIALNVGDTIKSALEGTVSRVDRDQKGYGLFVVIKHANDIETRYGHLNSSLVVPGQLVFAGTPIALGGNTGNSTGPHLHFETRFQGQALDPTMLFDFSTGNVNYNSPLLATSNPNFTDDQIMQAASSLQGRSTYVVKLGDTLTGIARKARISLHTLCRLNGLNSNSLPEPGRMLKLR